MKTPYYEFDLSVINNNYMCIKESLCVDKLFYALKANSEIEILKSLHSIGACFEVASIGEINKLLGLGVLPQNIICSLPIKSEEMIIYLYERGINYFVFDNIDEYCKLVANAPNARYILRVNITNIANYAIEYGMTYYEFKEYLSRGILNVELIKGITFYLSKNNNAELMIEILDYVENFLKYLKDNIIINLGGNFRLPYEVGCDYYRKVNSRLQSMRKDFNCSIFAEPGRSIVKNAGKLITSVVGYKESLRHVYIDAGEPTGISYCPNEILCENAEVINTCGKILYNLRV